MGLLNKIKSIAKKEDRRVRASGYGDGAASSWRRIWQGFNFTSADVKSDQEESVEKLRERSRSVWYNSGLARNIINCYADWSIAQGLELKSESRRKEELEAAFEAWALSKDCDARRDSDFYSLQRQIFESVLINGDAFVIFRRHVNESGKIELKLEAVEADQCRTPPPEVARNRNIVNGVELDRWGAAVAYWFKRGDSGEDKWIRVRREDEDGIKVLHVRRRERLGSVRGIPVLAPCLEPIVQIERYSGAELTSALMEACWSVVIKTDEPDPQDLSDNPLPASPYAMSLGSGNINYVPADSEITTIDGRRAENAGSLEKFVEITLKTQICAATGIPYEILMSQFSSSYSASRASCLLYARKAQAIRDSFVLDCISPIYKEFVRIYRINNDIVTDDEDMEKATWLGPNPPSLDPSKQIAYIRDCIELGLITRKDAAMEVSRTDYFANVEALKRENELLAKANAALEDGGEGLDQEEA